MYKLLIAVSLLGMVLSFDSCQSCLDFWCDKGRSWNVCKYNCHRPKKCAEEDRVESYWTLFNGKETLEEVTTTTDETMRGIMDGALSFSAQVPYERPESFKWSESESESESEDEE